MAGKGAKPGERRGGRAKGTPNKASAAAAAEMEATGETPKDYMVRVMRDPTVDHLRRDKMAIAAASYFHAHLAAVQVNGELTTRYVVEVPAKSENTKEWQSHYVPPAHQK